MEEVSAFEGYAPSLAVGAGNPEAGKYGRMWQRSEYRQVAPGEQLAPLFLDRVQPRRGASVIDFGCGTGRGAVKLADAGLRVTMVDFVSNCLDPDVREFLTTRPESLRFVKADLEQPVPLAAEYGFAVDLMEHIPEARVDRVLGNILLAAQHVFFGIATVEDHCGALIGERLHLTVQPYGWWLMHFARRGCLVHWSQNLGDRCLFYVSAWASGRDLVAAGIVNVSTEQIQANVRENIAQGWTPAIPHETNDLEVMILGGGPSLKEFEDEIKDQRARGVKLITLNGTYNWALERGLIPSAQVIVDARPFNARFVRPVVEGCKYLLASQCDPSVFAGLPRERTYLWHTGAEWIGELLTAQYPDGWCIVPGGSTVLLRAIPLLRMLGFRRMTLYGADSCLTDGAHHAYAQPENDRETILRVITQPDGRIFRCFPWMAAQASEFLDLVKFLGEEIELDIRGDGLLAHMVTVAASLPDVAHVTLSTAEV